MPVGAWSSTLKRDLTCWLCVTQTRDVLGEVITKEGLQANCMYCHKAGAQFDARPLCANCLYVASGLAWEVPVNHGLTLWLVCLTARAMPTLRVS